MCILVSYIWGWDYKIFVLQKKLFHTSDKMFLFIQIYFYVSALYLNVYGIMYKVEKHAFEKYSVT